MEMLVQSSRTLEQLRQVNSQSKCRRRSRRQFYACESEWYNLKTYWLSTHPPTFCWTFAWAFCTFAFVLFLVGWGCSTIWKVAACCGWWLVVWIMFMPLLPFSLSIAAYLSKMMFRSAGFVISAPSSRFTVMKFSIIHWFCVSNRMIFERRSFDAIFFLLF